LKAIILLKEIKEDINMGWQSGSSGKSTCLSLSSNPSVTKQKENKRIHR
jgi:hypothetical protein